MIWVDVGGGVRIAVARLSAIQLGEPGDDLHVEFLDGTRGVVSGLVGGGFTVDRVNERERRVAIFTGQGPLVVSPTLTGLVRKLWAIIGESTPALGVHSKLDAEELAALVDVVGPTT